MIIENINSIFNFGKHKGQTIKLIALIDPSYIEWCCKEVNDFFISNKVIDQLSEYCLGEFFKDPNAYLNEIGNFTLVNWQYLKYKNNEMTIGYLSLNDQLSNKVKPSNHLSISLSRLVFNGANCKKNLSKKVQNKTTNNDDYDDSDDSIDMDDLRQSYNDAYEINNNEFDGWHEPID